MNEIESLLTRGVVEVNTKADLRSALQSGKKLRIKFGIDPTGADIHLGHLVPLKKLAEFQKMGHTAVLLFGTFTGKIGDPTGKDTLRTPLTDVDIAHNMKNYLDQAAKVLDISKTEIVQNGDWLEKMDFQKLLQLAGSFTVSQMMHRDMFQKRLEKKADINLVEFLYPLMQGYDSVAIKSDVEIGGTDQLFNLMAGRTIQKHFGQNPQNILTVPILVGLDGVEKMSKSLKNCIAVFDAPREIFGKTMSLPDSAMESYFTLLTDFSREWIAKILSGHPRDAKLSLAHELTKMLHDGSAADSAQKEFLEMFQKKGRPDEMPKISLSSSKISLLDLVIASHLCASNGDARRMISQGAVKINDEKKTDAEEILSLLSGDILRVGKRRFVEILF